MSGREDSAALRTIMLTRRSLLGTAAGGAALVAMGGLAPAFAQAQAPQHLKLLFWQAVTLLNPHFAIAPKDQEGCRIFYEPLAGWDSDGQLVPVLAANVPTVDNGQLASDNTSVVWKLKPDVKWHDGQPFTADDVVFTWEYAKDPATAAVTIGSYRDITVEKVDDLTVKVSFPSATPYWANAFVGALGMIMPKHVFADYVGEKSREAPANLAPVGTGPYKLREFRPGDMILADRFDEYHVSGKPHFASLEVKGGGDAVSAARAVLQTGEYHFGLNISIEDDILTRLENDGNGTVDITAGGDLEMIQLNMSDPRKAEDGERSIASNPHPALSDPKVREALGLLIDRETIQKHIYGRTGISTANFLNSPARYVSPNNMLVFNLEKANSILDEAGWLPGAGGIREKDGVRLSFLFQTTVQALRQKVQAVVKQSFAKAGIEVELKSVAPAVFFSSDEANPDTNSKFYADMQMYTTTMYQPDPERLMNQFVSWEVASKANQWRGRNITRWQNEEYDRVYREATREIDADKRSQMFVQMNDLIVQSNVVLPVVVRPAVAATAKDLKIYRSAWDNALWKIADWQFSAG
ncbi:peptide ABC transporter substrate-binding protein [Mesorhizobium sp. CAU 1732]|uniref:peptide ABC transporter substrate-binding protein n=1 Tax=Mesorhizobium sp. CAU 1732 TaxID=3140358 RepID=UPI00325FEA23